MVIYQFLFVLVLVFPWLVEGDSCSSLQKCSLHPWYFLCRCTCKYITAAIAYYVNMTAAILLFNSSSTLYQGSRRNQVPLVFVLFSNHVTYICISVTIPYHWAMYTVQVRKCIVENMTPMHSWTFQQLQVVWTMYAIEARKCIIETWLECTLGTFYQLQVVIGGEQMIEIAQGLSEDWPVLHYSLHGQHK